MVLDILLILLIKLGASFLFPVNVCFIPSFVIEPGEAQPGLVTTQITTLGLSPKDNTN